MNTPGPVTGTSFAALWLRKLREAVNECRILPGRGYRVKHSPQGTTLDIIQSTIGGSTGSEVSQFKVNSRVLSAPAGTPSAQQYDCIQCYTWDWTTLGSVNTFIALPPELRPSLHTTGPDPNGTDTITYHYYGYGGVSYTYQRLAASTSGVSLLQLITPCIIVGNVIEAEVLDTGISGVVYQARLPGFWAWDASGVQTI